MKFIKVPGIDKPASRIALGVNKTGNKDGDSSMLEADRIAFCHKAMDLGVNLFDTAELYGGGYSEEILGKALSGNRRHAALICTKFNARNSKKEKIKNSIDNSLRRLNTDYLDLYLAHWVNPDVPLGEIVESLRGFKKEGKIRSYGISNVSDSEVNDFYHLNDKKPFVVENEYNLANREIEKKILPSTQRNGCLFMSYSPLLQGARFSQSKEVRQLTVKYDCTLQQLFLAWIHRLDIISTVRTTNINHLLDNIHSLNVTLDLQDQKRLEKATSIKKILIDIDSIEIGKKPYASIEEAILNSQDLIPSPMLLSKRLDNDCMFSPLKVVPCYEGYRILEGFHMSEIKKVWAWKLSKNKDRKIEAFVFNDLQNNR